MNDNQPTASLKRDMIYAVLGIVLFTVSLMTANWLDSKFGLTEAFSIVDLVSVAMKALVASAISFLLIKVGYRFTLGSGLGDEFDEGWQEIPKTTKTKIIIGVMVAFFATIMLSSSCPEKIATVEGLAMPVSEDGRDLIVNFEVGGKAYYQKRLSSPTWPGGASGVTIGFGYDLGYNTTDQIRRDWDGVLSQSEMTAILGVAGKRGSAGKYALSSVKHKVRVSWDEAQEVFDRSTMPRFTRTTKAAFGLSEDRLNSHCNGALVSLVFNRGSSMKGSRRREMANIRHHIAIGYAGRVPREIRAMKRLWAGRGLDGLLRRRDAEANLFTRGLEARRQGK